MSHVVHPYAHRIGILRDWKSRWFATRKQYKVFLREDIRLREFLEKRLRGFSVSSIDIERNVNTLKILIKTARPGMVIGRNGEGMTRLRKEVDLFAVREKIQLTKDLKLDIEEVRMPESDAMIVSEMIADGLEKRMPFRRVLKQTIEKVMASKEVHGVRIVISGRLGGADMSRSEQIKKGNIPLQTFRADIDFVRNRAVLPYGTIGIKVWIYKGEVFTK